MKKKIYISKLISIIILHYDIAYTCRIIHLQGNLAVTVQS
jgi:hypothetical protein